MTIISIQQNGITYNNKSKSFYVSGKKVKFATTYSVTNDLTGRTLDFKFDHATGSEWDPETIWVYKSSCGNYTLNVGNDDVTPQQVEDYLRSKTIY